MSKKKPLLFFLSIFLVSAFSPRAYPLTVEDLIDQLNNKYSSFEDVRMEFTQSISSDVFENKRHFEGQIYIKNPDKFRIETPQQTIIANGEYIWVYSEENKQVTKNRYDPSSGILLPYRYLNSFKDDYKARMDKEELIRKRWCYKLVLTPKDENSFVTKMIIWVDKETLLTLKLEYWDLNDNEVTFLFKNIRIDSKIDDSEFVFKIPPGIELLDLSE
ncbi:MAG: outer membrane lipoprotein carrier protein LolA [candidate division Zixibacteria bacterium]|nr:outer membrane lipoprotein carrier protein LolA [candidate division Zixibacteria bacterium]